MIWFVSTGLHPEDEFGLGHTKIKEQISQYHVGRQCCGHEVERWYKGARVLITPSNNRVTNNYPCSLDGADSQPPI